MQVETFEVYEVDASGKVAEVENAAEVKALIEKLGLEGQQQFVEPRQGGTAQVIPYRKITKEENFVYSVLCPSKVALSRFGESVIPLRVLQVAAHAKECGLFKELEVWHVDSAAIKDPVLIGKAGQWSNEIYLLARWGEVLEPMSVLAPKAVMLWRERTKAALQEILAAVNSDLASIEMANPIAFKGARTVREPQYVGFSW